MLVTYTQENAPTQFIEVHGLRYAYRRFGNAEGVPLVCFIHLTGTMDNWDPALINPLAEQRPIILMDNAGVGKSEGEVPNTIDGMATHALHVIEALGLKKFDLLGFSLGGYIAQRVTLRALSKVRRLILAGTGAGGSISTETPITGVLSAGGRQGVDMFLYLFFADNPESQAAGRAFWARLATREGEREERVSGEGAKNQVAALTTFTQKGQGTFDLLGEISQPVLVANGYDDIMIPTIQSYTMAKALPNALLTLYPKSGHGFLFQYPELFSKQVNDFLNDPGV